MFKVIANISSSDQSIEQGITPLCSAQHISKFVIVNDVADNRHTCHQCHVSRAYDVSCYSYAAALVVRLAKGRRFTSIVTSRITSISAASSPI